MYLPKDFLTGSLLNLRLKLHGAISLGLMFRGVMPLQTIAVLFTKGKLLKKSREGHLTL